MQRVSLKPVLLCLAVAIAMAAVVCLIAAKNRSDSALAPPGQPDSPEMDGARPAANDASRTLAQERSSHANALPAVDPNADDFAGSPGQRYPVSNLQAQFADLARNATAGDLIAVRTLNRALRVCDGAPRNAEDLASAERKFEDPNFRFSKYTAQGAEVLAAKKSLYLHCGALTDEQRKSRADWTRILADSGDSQARLEYYRVAQPDGMDMTDYSQRHEQFVEEAQRYLNAEIESGDPLALSAMANAYMPNAVSGRAAPFEQNPALAYAYFYAYSLSSEGREYTDINAGILAQLEPLLSPDEIEEARTTGTQIMNRCCS